jgi:hypothetical protein
MFTSMYGIPDFYAPFWSENGVSYSRRQLVPLFLDNLHFEHFDKSVFRTRMNEIIWDSVLLFTCRRINRFRFDRVQKWR